MNFPASSCGYEWFNDMPGIGLPAKGTGNIPAFTAINNSGAPVTATITAKPVSAGFAYIPNITTGTVSVINLQNNSTIATIPVGVNPLGVSISPDGSKVYITSQGSNAISVISTATNKVTATITAAFGSYPSGVVVSPDGAHVYYTNYQLNSISIISTATNAITSTINVGGNPYGITVSPDGKYLYVSNSNDGTISVINTATNLVEHTITVGTAPNGLRLSPDGSKLYVANYSSNNVSVINTSDNSVIATVDVGTQPFDVSISPDGNTLYVSDPVNNAVSIINTSTFNQAGSIAGVNNPFGMSLNPDGSILYVASSGSKLITEINTQTRSVSGTIALPSYALSIGNFVSGGPGCNSMPITYKITVNAASVVVAPPKISYQTPQTYPVYKTITSLSPKNTGGAVPADTYGQATVIAGNGTTGSANGAAASASFNQPHAIATDNTGNIYIADANNMLIRKITPAGVVSTFAGSGNPAFANGLGTAASFNYPTGLTTDAAGNVYVADQRNHAIRKITPAGVVSTLTGNGTPGANNGPIASATFNYPFGITIDAAGNLYVTDQSNNSVRKISTAGQVTTVATGFNQPQGIAVDAAGNLYVADFGHNVVKKITPSGQVSTLAGNASIGKNDGNGTAASFYGPTGVRVDAYGNLYITDLYNDLIRKIDIAGNVTTVGIAGGYDLDIDGNGNLLVGDLATNQIDEITVYGYTIDKPLPAGLTFDPTTGIISGTPTVTSPPTDYTVTAYNQGGSSSTIVNIAVNAITPVITTSTITGNIIGCVGSPSESPNIGQFTVAGTSLTGDITVTPPAGFDISLTAVGGYSPSLILKQVGGAVISTPIYVRSSASDPVGPISGDIQLTTPGATDNVPVTGVVNPPPKVVAMPDVSYNNGDTTTPITFTGTATSYTWTNDTPSIGLPASGTGDIPSFTATNTGSTTVKASIIVTPQNSSEGCSGTSITFRITVYASPGITAGPVSGTISACAGSASADPNLQQFTVSGSALTGDITATAPAGFEVSLSPSSGFGNTVTITQSGGSVSNVIVYVRSAATDPSGNISGNVVLSSPGITPQNVVVSGTINAPPAMNPVNNQTVNNDGPTAAISFVGNADTYTWTNDVPGIGLAASGTGNIPSFNAIDPAGDTPTTATIVVTPTNSVTGCTGQPVTFTITVNPPSAPSVSASGTLAGLNTVYGTPSSSESFTISATNTTADILVTPPQGFEVSTDGQTFSTTVTIPSAAVINNVQVYIRLAATTPAKSYTGDIVISTTGAADVDVNVPLSTVSKAILTVTAPDVTRAYGVPNPVFVPQYNKFVNGENQSVLTILPKLTTTATISSPIGQYTIHVDGGSADNYTIVPVDGTLTIVPAPSQIVVPNAFTPNGDGINDLWNIKELSDFSQCLVSVYDRYGSLVFQSRGYAKPWDGTKNGSPVPVGTYYYVIDTNVSGFALLSGYVAVLR